MAIDPLEPMADYVDAYPNGQAGTGAAAEITPHAAKEPGADLHQVSDASDPGPIEPGGSGVRVTGTQLLFDVEDHLARYVVFPGERVLGRRFWLHRDACIAASQLVEELGPLGARAWCRSLAEELDR